MAIPAFFAQLVNVSPRHSGSLSERNTYGKPRWARSCSNTRTSRPEVMLVSTSMCSASRLKSSTTLNVRKRRPFHNVWDMKSADHTRSGKLGTYSGTRSRLGRPFLAGLRRCRPIARYTRRYKYPADAKHSAASKTRIMPIRAPLVRLRTIPVGCFVTRQSSSAWWSCRANKADATGSVRPFS